ncbi:hypothetical protein Pla86_13060 [Planctomycetes bacterium Pla86]|uniref:Uncharacterized protein n=1 Tax=Engelhardtia mirabilis TaxID=2528011 RepID=A0A518BGX9_9BACT|nr:hypothetical protein Pla133_13060 [Planctomycetes bacterium Pla133]QDV00567.1 hypothetical protein Pla86_13060 [Planctomycetes bacterium Pla86]
MLKLVNKFSVPLTALGNRGYPIAETADLRSVGLNPPRDDVCEPSSNTLLEGFAVLWAQWPHHFHSVSLPAFKRNLPIAKRFDLLHHV